MKKNLPVLVLAVVMVLFFACSVSAAVQELILVNRTGVDVYQLYMSPTGNEDWEEDLLEGEIFKDGTEIIIEYEGAEDLLWDLLIMDAVGGTIEWYELNLNVISQLTLYFNGEKAWAEAK